MAKTWKCARCSTVNPETRLTCTNCGLIQGSVVVPGSYPSASSWRTEADASPTEPSDAQPPAAAPADGSLSDAAPVDTAPVDTPPVAAWVTGSVAAQPGEAPAVPEAKRPLWQRIPGWLIVVALVGAGSVGGLIFHAGRAPTGEITKPGDLTAADLRVGDCWDLKDPEAEEIDDVTAGPCTSEHEFEMFFVATMPAGDYPGSEGFADYVSQTCIPAFEAYIGTAYDDSVLDIFWLEPTVEAWADGDRAVQCSAYHPRIHRLTESVKGSKQ